MAIVIDTSVAAAWCFWDESGSAKADAVMARVLAETSIVPAIFWDEMRDILVVAERRGRIETETTECHLNRLRTLPLITDQKQDDFQTIALARRHGLSAYDTAYLETSKRRRAELVTLDRTLVQAKAMESLAPSIA